MTEEISKEDHDKFVKNVIDSGVYENVIKAIDKVMTDAGLGAGTQAQAMIYFAIRFLRAGITSVDGQERKRKAVIHYLGVFRALAALADLDAQVYLRRVKGPAEPPDAEPPRKEKTLH